MDMVAFYQNAASEHLPKRKLGKIKIEDYCVCKVES